MIGNVKITQELTDLGSYKALAEQRVGKGIAATVQQLQARAQENSRVDTGAQSISVGAVSTPNVGINDYANRMSSVKELNPKAVTLDAPPLPDVSSNVLGAAAVQCGVDYGIINDQGGAGRSGDGWFTKAVEEARDKLGANVNRELHA